MSLNFSCKRPLEQGEECKAGMIMDPFIDWGFKRLMVLNSLLRCRIVQNPILMRGFYITHALLLQKWEKGVKIGIMPTLKKYIQFA